MAFVIKACASGTISNARLERAVIPHGVIGNTTVFGTVILGSSPGGEASSDPRRPLKMLVGGGF